MRSFLSVWIEKLIHRGLKEYSRFYKTMDKINYNPILRNAWKNFSPSQKYEFQKQFMYKGYSGYTYLWDLMSGATYASMLRSIEGTYGVSFYGNTIYNSCVSLRTKQKFGMV